MNPDQAASRAPATQSEPGEPPPGFTLRSGPGVDLLVPEAFARWDPGQQRGYLARRLVKVDLLPQAADLLRYQVDNRLKGVAQSQVAADVAVIEIAYRRPQEALNILNRTRLAVTSGTLSRRL